MPQEIGAPCRRVGDACAFERETDHPRYNAWSLQRPEGCGGPEKSPDIVDTRPSPAQVIKDGITSILGQRQSDLPATFAAHTNGPFVPGDIIEPHRQDIAGAKAEARQQEKNRSVTDSVGLGEVAGSDDLLHRAGRQVAGQRRQAPLRNDRYRVVETGTAKASRCQEPEVPRIAVVIVFT